jgi:hypothetical protein
MAALVILAAIVTVSAVLFVAFVRTCVGIRRADKFGPWRPEQSTLRHWPSLAYVARWDDNRPAFA